MIAASREKGKVLMELFRLPLWHSTKHVKLLIYHSQALCVSFPSKEIWILHDLSLGQAWCFARGNNRWRIHQLEIDAAGDVPTRQEQRNNRESKPTQYLTTFSHLPTSSRQGREILLIQQSIQANTEGYFQEFQGIQYMRALALIYNQRVPGI